MDAAAAAAPRSAPTTPDASLLASAATSSPASDTAPAAALAATTVTWIPFSGQLIDENAAAVPPQPAPVIKCDQPDFSFGECTADALVAHEFVIWNRGDAPLVIDHVRACCGAAATLADQVVAPGNKTTVKVVASMRGRRGLVQRNVYLRSNDPQQPQYTLGIAGLVAIPEHATPTASPPRKLEKTQVTVNQPSKTAPTPIIPARAPAEFISAVPAKLQLASENNTTAPFQTLLVQSADRTSFQVTRVICPSDDWKVDLRPLSPGLWRIRIQHIVDAAAFVGKSVLIHTDVADFAVLSVPIK